MNDEGDRKARRGSSGHGGPRTGRTASSTTGSAVELVRELIGRIVVTPTDVAATPGRQIPWSYSTQPGNVARDGAGRNSPFAGALGCHHAGFATSTTQRKLPTQLRVELIQ